MTPGQFGPISRHFFILDIFFDPIHIQDRNALGNGNNNVQTGIRRFHDRIGRKRRRDKITLALAPVSFFGFLYRIKNRNVVHFLAALAGGYPCHHLGPVLNASPGVKHSLTAGYSLNHKLCIFINKYAHIFSSLFLLVSI
jgi:hypothetical protein